jgi:hypothetical protein
MFFGRPPHFSPPTGPFPAPSPRAPSLSTCAIRNSLPSPDDRPIGMACSVIHEKTSNQHAPFIGDKSNLEPRSLCGPASPRTPWSPGANWQVPEQVPQNVHLYQSQAKARRMNTYAKMGEGSPAANVMHIRSFAAFTKLRWGPMGQAKVFGSRPQFGAGGTLSEGHAIGAGRSNSRGICTYKLR